MATLIIRIAIGVLSVGFLSWWLYITYLGLKEFFRPKKQEQNQGMKEKHI